MDMELLKEEAIAFDEKGWHFSSSINWEELVYFHPSAINLINYAEQLRQTGKYNAALLILHRIEINDIPEKYKYQLSFKIGQVYAEQGNTEDAIENYHNCLVFGPSTTYPYVFLANELLKKELFDDAEVILCMALNKDGDIDEVYFNLGTLYARQGKYEIAIEMMNKCLNLDNKFRYAKEWLDDFQNIVNFRKNI